MVKIIDLSVPLEGLEAVEFPPKIKQINHKRGAELLGGAYSLAMAKTPWGRFWKYLQFAFGSRPLKGTDFPEGHGLAWEKVTIMGHRGTHFDAPWHFGPLSEGRPAKTIDQVPLESCYGNGVVLDLRHKKAGELISEVDLNKSIEKINYQLKPQDIVLLMTGADRHWGKQHYPEAHPGLSRAAVLYLLSFGIKLIGIDAFGFDRPFKIMIEEYHKIKDPAVLWPAHLAGRTREYYHIERMMNLDKIPRPFGFKIFCFPIKVSKGSMGWVRPVAIVEE